MLEVYPNIGKMAVNKKVYDEKSSVYNLGRYG